MRIAMRFVICSAPPFPIAYRYSFATSRAFKFMTPCAEKVYQRFQREKAERNRVKNYPYQLGISQRECQIFPDQAAEENVA
jgi:hypothetical protein